MKYKRKQKNKLIRTIIFMVLLFFLILGFTHSFSKEEVRYKTEVIVKGDTLWTIAEREISNNKYYENKDIRSIIQEIKHINNLQQANLNEGIELKIPVI